MKKSFVLISCIFIVLSCSNEKGIDPNEQEVVNYIDGTIKIGGFSIIEDCVYYYKNPPPDDERKSVEWIDTVEADWCFDLKNFVFDTRYPSVWGNVNCLIKNIRESNRDSIFFDKEDKYSVGVYIHCQGLSVDIIIDRENEILSEIKILSKSDIYRREGGDDLDTTLIVTLSEVPYTVNELGQITSKVSGDISKLITIDEYNSKQYKSTGYAAHHYYKYNHEIKSVYGLEEDAFIEITLNPE